MIPADQSITFGPVADKTYGVAPFELSGTASSGLPVEFESSDTTIASISEKLVTVKNAGQVIIRALQGGDSNWKSAAAVEQTLTITKAPLTVRANDATRTIGAPLDTEIRVNSSIHFPSKVPRCGSTPLNCHMLCYPGTRLIGCQIGYGTPTK